jgi:hypothetical protein
MKAMLSILAMSFIAAAPAEAAKLWKWVDKEGNVTYSETRPPAEATKAEEKQIDPKQNVIEMEIPPAGSSSTPVSPNTGGGSQTQNQNVPPSQAATGAAVGASAEAPPVAVTPPPPPLATPPLVQPPIYPSPPPGGR